MSDRFEPTGPKRSMDRCLQIHVPFTMNKKGYKHDQDNENNYATKGVYFNCGTLIQNTELFVHQFVYLFADLFLYQFWIWKSFVFFFIIRSLIDSQFTTGASTGKVRKNILLTNSYKIINMKFVIVIIFGHFHWDKIIFLIFYDFLRISWVSIFRYWTFVYCEITSDRLFLAAEHLAPIKKIKIFWKFQKSNWFFSEIIVLWN